MDDLFKTLAEATKPCNLQNVMISALNKSWAESRHRACEVRGEVAIRWALELYSDCSDEEINEAVREFKDKKH